MVSAADVSELHTPSSFIDQVNRKSEFLRICTYIYRFILKRELELTRSE
jgi:hypothetical protein